MKSILLFTVLMTSFNTGLIWTVQVVHYPGFLKVGEQGYIDYQRFHMQSIFRLVGPSMLIELILSTLLLFYIRFEVDIKAIMIYASYGFLFLIWLHTAFWAAPLHGRLKSRFDVGLIRQLIRINWIRTLLWSLRTLFLAYVLYTFV